MNLCSDCKYCHPINDKKGKCKIKHPERLVASNSMMNEVEIINGWPTVNIDSEACGEFKK